MTEGAIRWLVWGAATMVIVVTVCIAVLVMEVGSLKREQAMQATADGGEVDSLKARLVRLHGSIDSIRVTDARLRATVGTPAPTAAGFWSRLFRRAEAERGGKNRARVAHDSSVAEVTAVSYSADSLLATAGDVAGRFGHLADSIGGRARRLEIAPTAAWIATALSGAPTRGSRDGISVAREADGVVIASPPGTLLLAPAEADVEEEITAGVQTRLVLQHEGDLRTFYALAGEVVVRRGEHVNAGQVLARLDGRSNEPLRFEIRRGRQALPPTTELAARPGRASNLLR